MSSVFTGSIDRFHGVTVDSQVENCPPEEFTTKLTDSLNQWKRESKRAIWFKVGLEQSDWVPVLIKNGFDYHHAKNGFVMLYKWICEEEECRIPEYCHTMIGVGAIVTNDKSEVLVVREKYYTIPHWKLPGGYVEPGENLVDAAIREVLEETNVRTEFESLISLRHAHDWSFGCSDLYFIVGLKPSTKENEITICEKEIAESRWMDIEEYLNHPHVHELNRLFVERFLHHKERGHKIDCKHGIHQILKKPYTVYYIDNNPNSDL